MKKLTYKIYVSLSIAIILLSSILYILHPAYFNPFLVTRLDQTTNIFSSVKRKPSWTVIWYPNNTNTTNPGWTNTTNPGWTNTTNPGWTNPGWTNPGWTNPGWTNAGWKATSTPSFPIKAIKNQINLKYKYAPNLNLLHHRYYSGLWVMDNKTTSVEKNLTNAFLSKAKFPNLPFYAKEEFSSYEKLLNFLKPEIRKYLTNYINNYCPGYIPSLKLLIVKFYNYIAATWGKNIVNKILNSINIVKYLDADGISSSSHHMTLRAETLECHYNIKGNWTFTKGIFSALTPLRVFFHELGHMLHFFLDKVYIDIINRLKDFLVSKIIDLKKWPRLNRDKIFKLFHLSKYSFQDSYEFVAECFVYWFLIPNSLKTRAWEFWHEFLTLYLPKVSLNKNQHKN